MSEVGSEHVLVVPAELLRGLGYFQGFTGDVERYVGASVGVKPYKLPASA